MVFIIKCFIDIITIVTHFGEPLRIKLRINDQIIEQALITIVFIESRHVDGQS